MTVPPALILYALWLSFQGKGCFFDLPKVMSQYLDSHRPKLLPNGGSEEPEQYLFLVGKRQRDRENEWEPKHISDVVHAEPSKCSNCDSDGHHYVTGTFSSNTVTGYYWQHSCDDDKLAANTCLLPAFPRTAMACTLVQYHLAVTFLASSTSWLVFGCQWTVFVHPSSRGPTTRGNKHKFCCVIVVLLCLTFLWQLIPQLWYQTLHHIEGKCCCAMN